MRGYDSDIALDVCDTITKDDAIMKLPKEQRKEFWNNLMKEFVRKDPIFASAFEEHYTHITGLEPEPTFVKAKSLKG